MKCTLCSKKYTELSKILFNIKLSNHLRDVNKLNSLELGQYFKLPSHNFNRHGRFTLIEQLKNLNIDKDLATF